MFHIGKVRITNYFYNVVFTQTKSVASQNNWGQLFTYIHSIWIHKSEHYLIIIIPFSPTVGIVIEYQNICHTLLGQCDTFTLGQCDTGTL